MTQTTPMKAHWHVSTGLPGYGPGGATGDNEWSRATTWRELADLIKEELDRIAADLTEEADAIAGLPPYDDGRDYREAWITLKRAGEIDILARNFDNNTRADAPLYKDDPDLWDATIRRLADEHFPYDVSTSLRIYVWECIDPDVCERGKDEEDDF